MFEQAFKNIDDVLRSLRKLLLESWPHRASSAALMQTRCG
jgi:hypothetical protein